MDGSTAVPRGGPAIDGSGAFLLIITILLFFVPLLTFFPPVPPSKRDALLETHTQIGLRPARTGLTGQQQGAAASSNGAKGGESSSGKISSLWIYPLKSCRGIEVSQSKVLPTGLEFDRIYTFAQLKSAFPVDVHSAGEKEAPSSHSGSWHFITQRQFPLLATVQAELFVPDIIKARGQSSKVAEPFLLVRFPWQEPGLRGLVSWAAAKIARGWSARPEKEFLLPVAFPSREDIAALGYAYEDVTIWRDTVTALNLEAELPRELGLYLGVSNRLGIFRIDPDRLRNVYRCAPTKDEAGYQPVTGFQDAYPLHLLNLTSVRDFDAKIDKDDTLPALDPRRFRANIIVDGGDAPYDEDTWRKIRFIPGPGSRREASTFHVSCRTVRCKMPNVDQDTGYRHPVEPDRSLRKYRDVDEGATSMGCLGMQLTPLYSKTSSEEGLESWVEVGMSVEVLDRGSHVYIRQ